MSKKTKKFFVLERKSKGDNPFEFGKLTREMNKKKKGYKKVV